MCWTNLVQDKRLVLGPSEHGNEPSGYIMTRNFLLSWPTISLSKRN